MTNLLFYRILGEGKTFLSIILFQNRKSRLRAFFDTS